MPASRSRGSRKVPNVKIRSVPQLPTAPKKKIRDEKDADETTETESEGNDDEDRDADSAFQTDNANRLISPLSGCILCSTGIAKPEKTALVEKAKTMGASWQDSLVADVTHLIADGVDSAKYQAAIENDIHVQTSEWIHKLHSLWLDAEYFDFQKLTDQYRTPPLQNIRITSIAMTLSETDDVESLSTILGASYSPSVDDLKCTHILIGSLPFDPSTLTISHPPSKFLWSSWLVSCHKKWKLAPETEYIWKQDIAPPSALKQTLSSPTTHAPRKYKPSESKPTTTLPKRPVKKQRLNSSDALLSFGLDILTNKDTNAQKTLPSTNSEPVNSLKLKPAAGPSLSRLHRQASFVTDPTKAPRDLSDKVVSIPNNLSSGTYVNVSLFQDNTFTTEHMPLDRKAKLVHAITDKGGIYVDSPKDATWKIVPFINTGNQGFSINDTDIVSEWWIERCIFEDKIVDPLTNFGCKPIHLIPLSDPSKYKLTFSALDPCNERFLLRLCKYLNVDVSPNLRKNETTHVLIQSDESTGQKADKAKKWGISVVNIDWIRKLACGELDHELREIQSGPLSGLIIATSDKLDNVKSTKISENILKMSGRVVPFSVRDPNTPGHITHLIHSSERLNDSSRQVALARKMGAFICHPSWVDACLAQKKRICEEAYPHTYTPGRSLQLQPSSSNISAAPSSNPTTNLSRYSSINHDHTQTSPLAKEPTLLDKLLKDTTKSEINLKKRFLKRESNSTQTSSNSITSLSMTKEDNMHHDEAYNLNNTDDDQRPGMHVTYSDPKAEAARLKLMQRLESNRNHHENPSPEPPMNDSSTTPPEQEEQPPVRKAYAKRGRRKQTSKR